ncbi:MAG: flavin-containing monooxygenase [Acidimicrobiales bacterium]
MPITAPVPALLEAAAGQAEVTPLLCAVAQRTGDLSLLRPHWRPDQSRLLEPGAGVSPGAVDGARRAVAGRLAAEPWLLGDGVGGPRAEAGAAGGAILRSVLGFATGDDAAGTYLPLLRQELNLNGEDARAPGWHKDGVAPGRDFHVAVVGAGMSGIAAAHRLAQAGVECTVVEKNSDVGGTWLENTYPGCRVDVPSHLYSYSFAQRADWPQHYSSQPVLLDYFRRCAEELGMAARTRFSTEVVSAAWDAGSAVWRLGLRRPDGGTDELVANVVVSAVGQLNRPHVPDLPGAGRFAGPAFHSARWRHDVDLAGKRVAVIGTGASSAQLVPALAGEAGEVTVFQRTPAWLAPTPDYRHDVAPELRWLFSHLTGFDRWYRFWLFWKNAEGILPAARAEPGWDGGSRSVGPANDLLRQLLTGYLDQQFAGAPDLLSRVLPAYPPAAKRVLRDDGAWASALLRPDVHLVTEPIDHLGPEGVTTADGALHRADVVVYATGYLASDFLWPMQVVGAGGQEIHRRWQGDARAYLGMTVPGYPNLFCLYGPNTNIVVNGSIVYFAECQVGYLLASLRLLLATGSRAMDCRPEIHDAYNSEIDAATARTAWGATDVNSWYRNARGRVSQNWPGTLLEYWERTRHVDAADYTWS